MIAAAPAEERAADGDGAGVIGTGGDVGDGKRRPVGPLTATGVGLLV
jgi:hypothetical protein